MNTPTMIKRKVLKKDLHPKNHTLVKTVMRIYSNYPNDSHYMNFEEMERLISNAIRIAQDRKD